MENTELFHDIQVFWCTCDSSPGVRYLCRAESAQMEELRFWKSDWSWFRYGAVICCSASCKAQHANNASDSESHMTKLTNLNYFLLETEMTSVKLRWVKSVKSLSLHAPSYRIRFLLREHAAECCPAYISDHLIGKILPLINCHIQRKSGFGQNTEPC